MIGKLIVLVVSTGLLAVLYPIVQAEIRIRKGVRIPLPVRVDSPNEFITR